MKKITGLLIISLFLLTAMLRTRFITSVDASAATITGRVTYNERPLTEFTTVQPSFWARNEDTKFAASITSSYDSSTAEYSITFSEPGNYGINVFVDTVEPFDGKGFAGDFDGWTTPITVEGTVERDLPVCKILHLTFPKDNSEEIGHSGDPYDCYHLNTIFAWDALPEATGYEVDITLYQSDPVENLGTVYHIYQSDTEIRPQLPLNVENQHYVFTMSAYNGTKRVGTFMVAYDTGCGWDYKFRLIADWTDPVANAGSSQTVSEDTTVSFNADGSSDNVGIVSYEWDFGDETNGTGLAINHTYTDPANYTVTLTVRDVANNSDTDSIVIMVLLDTDGDATPDITDTDDDGDGIPDTWETTNGLNSLDATDNSLDPDGDGLTNLQEYQKNTNPNNYFSPFPLWIVGVAMFVVVGVAIVVYFVKVRKP